jgi:hypothetical protein
MRRPVGLLLCLLLVPGMALSAQRTNDEARLAVGLNAGYIGGSTLWHTDQPVLTNTTTPDVLQLDRRLRGNITVSGHLTYFPKPTVGVTGEVGYIGLGTVDNCAIATPPGDDFNRFACASLVDKSRAASAVSVLGGGIWRPVPRGTVQFYVKALAGLSLVPRSTTTVTAFFTRDFEDFALPVYAEDGSKTVTPTGALAIGFATAPNNGYQFSIELRATEVQLQVVDGPSAAGNIRPPIRSQWKTLPTLTAGFDIVLEKRRGRRY